MNFFYLFKFLIQIHFLIFVYLFQVTATDGDVDRPINIVYFLTGQGIDPDNTANSKFDINRTTGDIFVLKVSEYKHNDTSITIQSYFMHGSVIKYKNIL